MGSQRDSQRIVFCTYAGLYSSVVLERLLQCPGIELAGIVNSTRILRKRYGFVSGVVHLIRTSGFRYFLYLIWVTDLFHIFQRFSNMRSVREFARTHGVPILNSKDVNADVALTFIRSCDPDVIVSAYFNQLIGEQVLAVARFGGINIHPSALPQYRGTDPVFRALAAGDAVLGVTVHRIDASFDTGPVLRQAHLQVGPTATVLDCYAGLFDRGAELAAEVVGELAGAPGKAIAQTGEGSYHSWPTAAEVRSLEKKGHRLVSIASFFRILRRDKDAWLVRRPLESTH